MPNAEEGTSKNGSSGASGPVATLKNQPTTARPPFALLVQKVTSLESQVSQILSRLQNRPAGRAPTVTTAEDSAASRAPPVAEQPDTRAPTAGPAPSQLTSAHSVYADPGLQVTLPVLSAQGIADTVATQQLYGETGKLNLFQIPTHLAPFSSKRFIPESEKLFGRIRDADPRDGWEAKVLWNFGYDTEHALAASHKVAEALSSGNRQAATEAFSVLHHYLQASYERVQERLDFFSDSVESGKSEAVLPQKYLREQDQPYVSQLCRDTKQKFAQLRSQAYAKDFNKQAARNSGTQASGRVSKGISRKGAQRLPPRNFSSGGSGSSGATTK